MEGYDSIFDKALDLVHIDHISRCEVGLVCVGEFSDLFDSILDHVVKFQFRAMELLSEKTKFFTVSASAMLICISAFRSVIVLGISVITFLSLIILE